MTSLATSSGGLRRRQRFWASVASLKTIVRVAIREPEPLVRWVRSRTVAKVDSMGLVVRRCDQCSRRKVIEGKQDFFIFLQAFAGLWKFSLVTEDELTVSCQSRFAGRRQVHFMDQLLGLALNTFGHFIQDIRCLMHPATLLCAGPIFFLQRDPKSKRTVADGQLGRGGKPQAFQLAQKFTPGLGAFAITVDNG
jgi:hypothetical protein